MGLGLFGGGGILKEKHIKIYFKKDMLICRFLSAREIDPGVYSDS